MFLFSNSAKRDAATKLNIYEQNTEIPFQNLRINFPDLIFSNTALFVWLILHGHWAAQPNKNQHNFESAPHSKHLNTDKLIKYFAILIFD